MSVRSSKLSITILLCIGAFLGWRCWVLFSQEVTANFIDKECKITQESFINHLPTDTGFDPAALAQRLDFLIGYYESRSSTLTGSHLEQIVRRDYEHTLTNALAVFRRDTTNDLGGDPRVWIQRYEK